MNETQLILKKLDGMETAISKIDGIEAKLNGMEVAVKKIDGIETKLNGMEVVIADLHTDNKSIHASLAGLHADNRGIQASLAELRGETAELRADNADFRSSQSAIIDKLFEMDFAITGIQDTMATKDDLRATEGRLMDHVDGFAKRQEKFDVELLAMGSRFDRFAGRA